MFRVLNFNSLIKYCAIATASISLAIYIVYIKYIDPSAPLLHLLKISPWVVMFMIFVITNNTIARFIWSVVRSFNRSTYPDLNGIWAGFINTSNGQSIPVRANIRQTLILTQIDMHSDTAKSQTLEATPIIESGQDKLYYTYLSRPKNPDWGPYIGLTIFDVRGPKKDKAIPLELSGFYFTDRKTSGRISLHQVSSKCDDDASFY